MTEERLTAIAALVEHARARMSPERAFALLTACAELVVEVRRLTPRQVRLGLEDVA